VTHRLRALKSEVLRNGHLGHGIGCHLCVP
jgi:hypothetical protein